MKAPTEFPKVAPQCFPAIAINEHASVKIYRTTSRGYDEYKIPYRGDDGQRRYHRFPDYERARSKGNEMLTQLLSGNGDAITLGARDKHVYCRALEAVKPFSVSLDDAARDFAEARKALNGHTVSLVEAVRYYARMHKTVESKTVQDAKTEMLRSKQSRGKSVSYIKDLEHRLGAFAESFGSLKLEDVQQAQIQSFLDGLRKGNGDSISPRSKNNFRGAIIEFFEFAKRQKYLPREWDELSGIEKVEDAGGEITTYSPEEISKLLNGASAALVPFLSIGAFAGLRSTEICRLQWQDVNLASGWITLKAKVRGADGIVKRITKTGSRRIVPISDNLRAWLEPYRNAQGMVWGGGDVENGTTYIHTGKLCRAVGVQWKKNALRHSFISYRVAQTQNINQVALEAGNSPAMIHQHYRELVTPDQAKAWFEVRPAA